MDIIPFQIQSTPEKQNVVGTRHAALRSIAVGNVRQSRDVKETQPKTRQTKHAAP